MHCKTPISYSIFSAPDQLSLREHNKGPRSGERMQPTAQAVCKVRNTRTSPGGAKERSAKAVSENRWCLILIFKRLLFGGVIPSKAALQAERGIWRGVHARSLVPPVKTRAIGMT